MNSNDIDQLIQTTSSHIDLGVDKEGIRLSLKSKGLSEDEVYLIYVAAKQLSKARE